MYKRQDPEAAEKAAKAAAAKAEREAAMTPEELAAVRDAEGQFQGRPPVVVGLLLLAPRLRAAPEVGAAVSAKVKRPILGGIRPGSGAAVSARSSAPTGRRSSACDGWVGDCGQAREEAKDGALSGEHESVRPCGKPASI